MVRDGTLIMVDDDRMPLAPGEVPEMREVRFRTLVIDHDGEASMEKKKREGYF